MQRSTEKKEPPRFIVGGSMEIWWEILSHRMCHECGIEELADAARHQAEGPRLETSVRIGPEDIVDHLRLAADRLRTWILESALVEHDPGDLAVRDPGSPDVLDEQCPGVHHRLILAAADYVFSPDLAFLADLLEDNVEYLRFLHSS